MSVDYIFGINIAQRGTANLTSVDIIQCYLEAGWSLYSEKNQIIYAEVGDNDDFNLIANSISQGEYFDIVKQKEKNNEIIAFSLFCLEENCRYRIDIEITPEFEIIISPDDGTKRMLNPDLNILDVNWYLCKVLPPLTNKDILVESYSFIQT